jgi:hypothetical protein
MTIPPFLLVLFLAHILGDFYFYFDRMAKMKKTFHKWLLAHGAVYEIFIALSILAFVLLGGVVPSWDLLWIFLLVSVSHIVIDFMKVKNVLKISKWSFTIDQAAHFGFMLLAWLLWGKELSIEGYIYDYARYITIVLGLLIIIRPIGLLVESGDIWKFTTNNEGNPEQANASRMIGYLERLIVYFLLLNGEYGAIGLVIAAKSIARFPEISNKESYLQANYYIIGTFLSLTAVFAITVFLGLTP